MEQARNRLFAAAGDLLRYRISLMMEKYESKVGSPIERLYLEALLAAHAAHLTPMPAVDDDPPGPVHIFLQALILGYRVDFLLRWKRSYGEVKCVVECDGHEFHERTKEQAERDKKRDRELQGAGYMVLRFTGSQIYRDPLGCAGETVIHIGDALRRLREGESGMSSEETGDA